MLLTPDWATFFSAELAALAALTGFVVVAISINLSRILAYAALPRRAGEALIGPVGAITVTSLMLIPDQPAVVIGAELLAVGALMVVVPLVLQLRWWRERQEVTTVERVARAATSVGYSFAFVIGGALIVEGVRAGLYWIAAGIVACVLAVVFNAWVLMIEILR